MFFFINLRFEMSCGFDCFKKNNISEIMIIISIFVFFCGLFSCSNTPPATQNLLDEDLLVIPKGFPQPVFPANNPYSKAKAELGRMLYYEKLLSRDTSIASCSHCFKQPHGFSDDTEFSLGYNNEPETRNTMSHQNLVYRTKLMWDGRGTLIENNAYRSLWLPYVLASDTNEIVKRLEAHPLYPDLFKKAFGENVKISATLVAQAISTFVRVLITGDSPYDKFINGDKSAMNESQIRGKDLFFGDRAKCSVCHAGFLFTDEKYHNTGVVSHYFDRGLYEVTKKDADRGKFLTPTLRNVELSAPYMHNGEITTLEEIIEHYNRGGRAIIYKDTILKPLNLSSIEKADLLNFLKALTDKKFVENKKFSNPMIK